MPDGDGVEAAEARCAADASYGAADAALPAYLERHYWWAYLRPASLRTFDHPAVVSAILWGRFGSLARAALAELAPGSRVLQLACVYGDLSERLVTRLGQGGRLDVVDVAPIQVENARRKLARFSNTRVWRADATVPGPAAYDAVLVFFLLHELPDAEKRRLIDAALGRLTPGGRAIFVDYARPERWHPLRPVMRLVFFLLEPFAATMWRRSIRSFASAPALFHWRESRAFGGLYQIVVAERRA